MLPKDLEVGGSSSVNKPSVPLETTTKKSLIFGIFCAIAAGTVGGSILVPLSGVDEDLTGLAFLPSFCIGGLFASTLITAAYHALILKIDPLDSFTLNGLIIEVMSGIIWNVGNACSLFAIRGIGYAIALPILQCALFFGGLFGIFIFKEATDEREIFVFFSSAAVLFVGAIFLSVSTNV